MSSADDHDSERAAFSEPWAGRLQLVLKHLPDLVACVRADGTLELLSRTASGAPTEQVIGRSVREFVVAESQPALSEALERVFGAGEPVTRDLQLVRLDGVVAWFTCRFFPHQRDGRTEAVVICSDFTVHRRMEEQLRRAAVELEERVQQRTDELARANANLREHVRTLELVEEINLAVAAQREIEPLMQAVVEAGSELTGAQFAAFCVEGELRHIHVTPDASQNSRAAFREFCPALVRDILAGERRVVRTDDVAAKQQHGVPVRSYVAAQIVSCSGDVLGGLFFGHSDAHSFDERAERIVAGIAAQAAVALENARLNEALLAELAERKRAETALRMSEQRLRQIFDQSPLSMYRIAPGGRLLQVNRACERLWGLTMADAPDYNVLEDEQLAERGTRQYFERALAGEATETPPVPYVLHQGRLAGQERWTRSFIYPVTNEQGTVEELVVLQEDVTESRRVQQALAESEARFRAIFDSAAAGISLIGVSDGHRLLQGNRALEEMLGYEPGELCGRPVLELTHPDDRPTNDRLYRELLDGERDSFTIEKRYRRKDGTDLFGRLTASLIRDVDGEPVYCVGIVEDVSDRMRAEQALRRAERLATVGTLAAGIAHEINNPLFALTNSIGVAERYLHRPEGRKRVQECLELMRQETDRVQQIVRSVQQLARHGVLERTNQDLRGLVLRAIDRKRHLAAERNVKVRLEAPSDLPRVPVNAIEMEQVVVNLVKNAIQASEPGSEVVVQLQPHSKELTLEVEDRGRGISASELPHIFDPFFTTQADAGGTGLGLSIVHEIVAHHGGRVHVHSVPGQGTRFEIHLPRDPEAGPSVT